MGTNPLHQSAQILAETLEQLAEAVHRGMLHAVPASVQNRYDQKCIGSAGVMGTNPLHQDSEFMAQTLERLAEAVYRGVLHALPASARAWFGDFRDRGLSAAVEVSLLLLLLRLLLCCCCCICCQGCCCCCWLSLSSKLNH